MFSSAIPTKFSIPWANSAVPGTGVRAIPTGSQIGAQPGAASLTDGFPPLNFLPVGAGGVPPFGQDMNGILQQVTAWLRWSAAGGPVRFDAAYATAIGGYPAGAFILSDLGHVWYESTTENNSNNPNLGGAGWRIASSVWSASVWVAGGSANAQLLTFSPVPTSSTQIAGIPFTFRSVGTSTAAVTLSVNAVGAAPLLASNGSTLSSGALVGGGYYQAVYDSGATAFRLLTGLAVFTDSGVGGVTISGPGTTGANLVLQGNGGTTPSKFIRAVNGVLQFMNSAYTTVIAQLSDLGDLTGLRNLTASGNAHAASGTIDNGLSVGGLATVGGNLVVTGSIGGSNGAAITGNMHASSGTIDNGLSVGTLATVGGNLVVTGVIGGSSGASITGDVHSSTGTIDTTLAVGTSMTAVTDITCTAGSVHSVSSANTQGFAATSPTPVLELVSSTTGNTYVLQNSASILTFSFNTTGIATINSSGTYTTTSDALAKEDFTEITGALDLVDRLQPGRYRWKATGDHGIGFRAQDVRDVIPEAVSETANGLLGVAYGELGATFSIAAIKELRAESRLLRERLDRIDEHFAS